MGEGGRGGRRTRRVGEGFKRFHFTSLVLISSGLWIPGMGVFFYFFSKTLDFGEFWTALCLFSSSFFFFLFCFVTVTLDILPPGRVLCTYIVLGYLLEGSGERHG